MSDGLSGSGSIVDTDVETVRSPLCDEQLANLGGQVEERGLLLWRRLEKGCHVAPGYHERMAHRHRKGVEKGNGVFIFHQDLGRIHLAEETIRSVIHGIYPRGQQAAQTAVTTDRATD
ncbi:hypothetical protein GMST_00030 [Geomonas silvestris]|uniref:Uncharacterized protein n=1 Tax=Geomonas silvestris TaxID=2740184 RepID=A0A6V8MCF1_9BACT|nr:hypothetical protein GMST_00030 [Geomonas silvestris]